MGEAVATNKSVDMARVEVGGREGQEDESGSEEKKPKLARQRGVDEGK